MCNSCLDWSSNTDAQKHKEACKILGLQQWAQLKNIIANTVRQLQKNDMLGSSELNVVYIPDFHSFTSPLLKNSCLILRVNNRAFSLNRGYHCANK